MHSIVKNFYMKIKRRISAGYIPSDMRLSLRASDLICLDQLANEAKVIIPASNTVRWSAALYQNSPD